MYLILCGWESQIAAPYQVSGYKVGETYWQVVVDFTRHDGNRWKKEKWLTLEAAFEEMRYKDAK